MRNAKRIISTPAVLVLVILGLCIPVHASFELPELNPPYDLDGDGIPNDVEVQNGTKISC